MEENFVRSVKDENGNEIRVEVIETFSIPEFGKSYMAYTLNDDGVSDTVQIQFVELLNADSERPTIKPVDQNETEIVINAFNSLIDSAE